MANYSYQLKRNYGSHGILYAGARRSKSKRPKWPFGILILLILAAVITITVCYFNNIDIIAYFRPHQQTQVAHPQASSEDEELLPTPIIVSPEAQEITNKGPVPQKVEPKQTGNKQEPERFEPILAQDEPKDNEPKQSGRDIALEEHYRRAYVDYSIGNYVEARKTLWGLFETLTPQDSIYKKSTQLLNRISKTLYDSGTDPEICVIYKVVSGDTLSAIAKKFGTTVATIQSSNKMTNTKLKIGQELKIYRSNWSVEIRRASSELVVLFNGKISRFYKVYPGTYVSDSLSGDYKIVDKNPAPEWKINGQTYPYGSPENICGARLIALNPVVKSSSTHSTAIHGSNSSGTMDTSRGMQGYFRMSNEDVKEIYDLLPTGTRVSIIAQ